MRVIPPPRTTASTPPGEGEDPDGSSGPIDQSVPRQYRYLVSCFSGRKESLNSPVLLSTACFALCEHEPSRASTTDSGSASRTPPGPSSFSVLPLSCSAESSVFPDPPTLLPYPPPRDLSAPAKSRFIGDSIPSKASTAARPPIQSGARPRMGFLPQPWEWSAGGVSALRTVLMELLALHRPDPYLVAEIDNIDEDDPDDD